jgi:hypothetical protein
VIVARTHNVDAIKRIGAYFLRARLTPHNAGIS